MLLIFGSEIFLLHNWGGNRGISRAIYDFLTNFLEGHLNWGYSMHRYDGIKLALIKNNKG